MFYSFNINTSNFNFEIGGQTIISKSVTFILRPRSILLEIAIPDPWSSFSVSSYNKLERRRVGHRAFGRPVAGVLERPAQSRGGAVVGAQRPNGLPVRAQRLALR
jgi:hypothetical protein